MQGSIKSGGYVAKCASRYGLVVTDQTDRLFFVGYDFVSPECGCSPVPVLWYFPLVRSRGLGDVYKRQQLNPIKKHILQLIHLI